MQTRLAVALLTSLALAACANDKPEAAATAPKAVVTTPSNGSASTPVDAATKTDGSFRGLPTADPNRKVIRTGRMDLVIRSYDDTRAKLDALLASAGGYVDSTQVQHYQRNVSSATLVLRVPQDGFGQLVPKLEALGQVSAESTNANDITDQFVDVSARLESAKTLEKRLLELASDRASGVEALLAVERELARVRGEIESYEGRLRQWNDQIAMSTLTLTLTTEAPAIAAVDEPGLGTRIANGFSDSITALESFAASLAIAGTALLPWLILIVPAFLFGRRLFRRYAKKLPTAVASPRAQ